MAITVPSTIDWMVSQRFGKAVPKAYLSTPSGNTYPYAEAAAYKAELQALSPDELSTRYAECQAAYFERERLKAEAEERGRFFNQPGAAADFEHWSRASYWTLEEAVALSLGKSPKSVSAKTMAPYASVSPVAGQYGRVLDLAKRAVWAKQLWDPVYPTLFLAWAKRMEIHVVPELIAAVEARGHQIADWKALFDQLKANHEAFVAAQGGLVATQRQTIEGLTERVRALEGAAAAAKAKPFSTRERETLLKVVIGMAVRGYAFDPKSVRSDRIPEIVADLALAGVPVGDDTVRKLVREGAELLPPST
jgi:hypothetical protein